MIALASAIGAQWMQTARWRGRIDAEMERAKQDRDILHARIGAKEEALERQLKELTQVVSELRIEVARLSERLGHVESH